MGWFNESEDWILFQEGDGPDPRGEGGCLSNLGCLVLVILGFILFMSLG